MYLLLFLLFYLPQGHSEEQAFHVVLLFTHPRTIPNSFSSSFKACFLSRCLYYTKGLFLLVLILISEQARISPTVDVSRTFLSFVAQRFVIPCKFESRRGHGLPRARVKPESVQRVTGLGYGLSSSFTRHELIVGVSKFMYAEEGR